MVNKDMKCIVDPEWSPTMRGEASTTWWCRYRPRIVERGVENSSDGGVVGYLFF